MKTDLCKLLILFPGQLLETMQVTAWARFLSAEFAQDEDFNLNWLIFCKTLKVQSEADGVK